MNVLLQAQATSVSADLPPAAEQTGGTEQTLSPHAWLPLWRLSLRVKIPKRNRLGRASPPR
jgi:hypothetical protein